jgi:YidC/Oxa1 family membrane protein insertase
VLGPLYWAISWILLQWHTVWNFAFGNSSLLGTNWAWVLAIVFLVLTIRGILFPVFVKQIKSQRAMQAIAPQIKELQAKHKGDRETLQKEMMELYRKEKANPLMGCLPMVVQIPVFLSLFHVLRHLRPNLPPSYWTLYGWTADQFKSASHAKLFGAPIAASFRSSSSDLASMQASGTTVKIVASVLIVIMIATTFMTTRQMIRKTGWAEDPQQKMIQRLMLYGIPFSLLISGVAFPIGVVIYWTTTNLFTLGQQFWVLRKYPPPKNVGKTATSGAAKSAAGSRTAKTGAKAPVGRPEPSPAAKALAPKVGAKPAPAKKTASPGLQARRAAAEAAKKAAAPANNTAPPGTPTDTGDGAGQVSGAGVNGSVPLNGATPTDTPSSTPAPSKATSSSAPRPAKSAKPRKGSAARRG